MEMIRYFNKVLCATLMTVLAAGFAGAAGRQASPATPSRIDPAFVEVPDDPCLPRVLLIGDSVSIGYTPAVRKLLAGKANVHRPLANCGSTSVGLLNLDKWLGSGRWDVIHFNFGLHDLSYIFPNGSNQDARGNYATRGTGRHKVPPAQYEQNLREILMRLKKTGARLIWCTTTPVPVTFHAYVKGDEREYNTVATRVMRENGITIDDLCTFAQPQLERIQIPENVHFTAKGSEALAGQVVRSIKAVMSLEKAAMTGPSEEVRKNDGVATIENGRIQVSFDLKQGTWSAADKKTGRAIIAQASARLGEWSANSPGVAHTFSREGLGDALGLGRSLLVRSAVPSGPTLLLRISLYDNQNFISLAAGLENTTGNVIQLKDFSPLEGGIAFKGFDTQSRFSTLDGNGGGQQTFVAHDGKKRTSLNNLLVTFGNPGANRSLVLGGLSYAEFEKYAEAKRGADGALKIRLYANDPVGKRIDPGMRYLPEDRFYVDFQTNNPFDALDAYARSMRLAQHIVLPVCRFPIMDTWFAQVPHFGGGEDRAGYRAQNDSVGAVEEMECAARSGFLKYSPVAVLLEPDLYDPNNQQGWWDDEHWRRGPNNRAKGAGTWVSSHGQFVAPYETARKWAGAVKALGGIPMIYVQTGFRSQDYAEKFPEHMLFNTSNAPHLNDKGEQQYRDKEKKEPRKLGYDYTDPGFIAHVREVWENLRLAGVQGVKFDYPDYAFTGWPTRGGMEDKYATTAMHYRNIFRLAQEGLGPEAFIHERTLERGSDVTLGLVTSQRTEGDTDRMTPAMISRVGLRWYKNRVVVNYDMDGKNPFHALPANRDGERAMWTMSYVAAGTLMVVPSFGRMSQEQVHDLSRIYPFHSDRQSPRPVDAFTSKWPRVYDYKVNPKWHEVAFYNTDTSNSATIGVDLAGDTAFGALGLDAAKQYYVYDFWNDCLAGKLSGKQRLEQTLRPGEARMMAVREAEANPQVLATDRHIMQGLVDLLGCDWDAQGAKLRGVSTVVGGESYRVIIATNGRQPIAAAADETIEKDLAKSRLGAAKAPTQCTVRMLPSEAGLAELSIVRPDNGPVAWSVSFK